MLMAPPLLLLVLPLTPSLSTIYCVGHGMPQPESLDFFTAVAGATAAAAARNIEST